LTHLDQVRAAASNGLTAAEIEAGIVRRPLTDDERAAYHAARGLWKLREAKRKAEKKAAIRDDRARMAENRDAAIAIDAPLAEARERIDWTRRRAAEKSLTAWIDTYCIGVLLNDPPPAPHGVKILREMEEATVASRPYQILVARGGGKTSYTECCAAYAIATGRRRFCLISSINAKQAQQILREITAIFTADPFAQDYPDIALPIQLLDGHGRRSQRQAGHDTRVRIVTDETLLPTITLPDGSPSIASGACIRAKALKSVRGTKNGTQRPDLVILDDLQTREIAENDERVADVLSLIRGDVMGLAGKNKAAIISTATTIAADDLTEQLAADTIWKTTRNPAILKWPDEWAKENHGLWGEYFAKFDDENAHDLKHTRRDGSIKFYRANRSAMDAGADILNWQNFDSKSGQISGLQKLLDAYHQMGHASFMAEYQMEPQRHAFLVNVTPKVIASRVRRGVERGTTIENAVFIAAATDINPSYGFTTVWQSWDVYKTFLVGGYWVMPARISDAVNDTQFQQSITEGLVRVANTLKSSGVNFAKWGIDASGKQWTSVTRFANIARAQHGIDAVAMTGRAGRNWNPNVSSRIREARNGTVLCRDKSTGFRFMAFNADEHKESYQRSFISEVGVAGGGSLFDGGFNHSEFAVQICNERLTDKRPIAGGLAYAYSWKSKDPHDLLDCGAMLDALAGADGLNGSGETHAYRNKRRVYNA